MALEAMGSPEQMLIDLAKEGDPFAFDHLVSTNHAAVHRVATSMGLSSDEAADAVQEGLVRAHRALGRFRAGQPFRPWLAAIVANEARGVRRRRSRHARVSDRLRGLAREINDSPESALIEQERARELHLALTRLRPKDRRSITSRYFLELSEEETAAVLGVPRGTVKSRLSRAMARLRLEIGERS